MQLEASINFSHMSKIIVLVVVVAITFTFPSFQDRVPSNPDPHPGEALSKQYCGICHLYPDPSLLDLPTWNNFILPRMGYFLGIYPSDSIRQSLIETDSSAAKAVENAGIFPMEPMISLEDWDKILDFYQTNAPLKLPEPQFPVVEKNLSLFNVKFPALFLSPPSSTLVKIAKNGGVYLGDANTQTIHFLDNQLRHQVKAKVREGAVSLIESDDDLLVTIMGSFSPTDAALGMILRLPLNPGRQPEVLIDKLQRPVHTSQADLDADGLPDLIISEFGKWTGQLAWWKQLPGGAFKAYPLRKRSGAIRTIIRDVNGDGLPDIYGLFGQGDEGIWLYINRGEGKFEEKSILRFPSTFGSSFFDIKDVDGDGVEEILYTCGDNADYPPFTKAYHGLRIYKQEAPYIFKEAAFVPLPGAYSVAARDFDKDGDADLALISFFPDYEKHPELGFIFMENKGSNVFSYHTFPQVDAGRWLVMDAGDVDHDGDDDLMLGSLTFEVVPPNPILEKWVKNGIPFILLENNRIKGKD